MNSEPCQASRRQDCREVDGGGYAFTESPLGSEVRNIKFNQVPEIQE